MRALPEPASVAVYMPNMGILRMIVNLVLNNLSLLLKFTMAGEERKTIRIPVLMTPSELSALDDWAFANRVRSRGEAIRRLVQAGMKSLGAKGAAAAQPKSARDRT